MLPFELNPAASKIESSNNRLLPQGHNIFQKMVVEPIRQNGQAQCLTTALKNICRDYPAGGTVLRELLQNADDAGATEVVRNFPLSVDLINDLIS